MTTSRTETFDPSILGVGTRCRPCIAGLRTGALYLGLNTPGEGRIAGTGKALRPTIQSSSANSSAARASAALSASVRINVGTVRTGQSNPAASSTSAESMIHASTIPS